MTDDKQTLIFEGLELDFPGKFHQTVATLGTLHVFTQTFYSSNIPVRFTDTYFFWLEIFTDQIYQYLYCKRRKKCYNNEITVKMSTNEK